MGAIVEFTDWENAVDNAQPVKMTFTKPDTHPETVFIQLEGQNPGYKVGETVTYHKGDRYVSGKIYYIYQGANAFNLYIRHPDWRSYDQVLGGEVMMGTVSAPPALGGEPGYTTGSAADVYHADQESSQIITPSGKVLGGDEMSTKGPVQESSLLPAGVKPKTLLYIGGGILGLLLISKLLK